MLKSLMLCVVGAVAFAGSAEAGHGHWYGGYGSYYSGYGVPAYSTSYYSSTWVTPHYYSAPVHYSAPVTRYRTSYVVPRTRYRSSYYSYPRSYSAGYSRSYAPSVGTFHRSGYRGYYPRNRGQDVEVEFKQKRDGSFKYEVDYDD